ncbi:MAG: filamentous hemagglutinin N-terminal domain-containing protein, partial [Rubrivivax sp.]
MSAQTPRTTAPATPRTLASRPLLQAVRQARRQSRLLLHPVTAAACLALAAPGAWGLPEGAVPTFGQTTVTQTSPSVLTIHQGTQRAGLDWTSFNIAAQEKVLVNQPNSSAVLLNRVLGNDPSQIFGQLQANGQVWLINPRGIVFGAQSRVDVGGLLASTLSITNEDLASGRLVLGKGAGPAGELRSEGQITAPGGNVLLVAPHLTHSGSITARRVGLAAAAEVVVDVEGDGLLFFNVRNDEQLDTRLSLLGNVLADGGSAEVRAAARAGFADTVLNMAGVVQARGLGQQNGRVVIDGGAHGITLVGGTVDVSGREAGQIGGDVVVLGDKLALTTGALIDASGDAGGGQVRVGGDYQGKNTELRNSSELLVQSGATLKADALGQGDGGRVILWSDDSTRYFGLLSAQGGLLGGHGGFAEVSGKNHLYFAGQALLGATQGLAGTLLLDPTNIVIDQDGGDAPSALVVFGASGAGDATFSTGSLNALLTNVGSTVVLQARNNISLFDSATDLSGAGSLTLQAGGTITLNDTISVQGLTLSAGDNGAGTAVAGSAVTIANNIAISAGSGTLTITNNGGSGIHQLGGNLTAGTLAVTGGVNLTQAQTWTLGSGTTTLASALTGAALTKAGAGTLALTNTANAHASTQVDAGTLSVGSSANVLGTGALTLNGGTLTFSSNASFAKAVAVSADSTVDTNGQTVTMSGVVSGASALTKAGTGTLDLAGNNSFTGALTVSNGTLALSNNNAAGTSAGGITVTGGTLDLRGVALGTEAITLDGGALTASTGTNSANGTITLQASGTHTLNVGSGASL